MLWHCSALVSPPWTIVHKRHMAGAIMGWREKSAAASDLVSDFSYHVAHRKGAGWLGGIGIEVGWFEK